MRKTVLVFVVAVMCALFSSNIVFGVENTPEKVRTASRIELNRGSDGLVTSVFILDQKLAQESDRHVIMHDLSTCTAVKETYVTMQTIGLSYHSKDDMVVSTFLESVLAKRLGERIVVVFHH
jgi:hypothetical protein